MSSDKAHDPIYIPRPFIPTDTKTQKINKQTKFLQNIFVLHLKLYILSQFNIQTDRLKPIWIFWVGRGRRGSGGE